MNKVFILLVLSLFFVSSFAQFQWTSCGQAGDDFKIADVSINPDPPLKGQNVSVVANGTMNVEVTGGKYVVAVKYGFVTVLDQTQDVCTPPVVCPIPAGPFNSALPPLSLPSDSPNGKYNGNAKITDQNGNEIACVNFSFTLAGK